MENAFGEVGGRVYLVGGRGTRPLDIYDPATRRWSRGTAPGMEIHHVQAVGHGGRLYLVGALTGPFPDEALFPRVLVYDPAADRWTAGAAIPAHRNRGTTGVAVHEGRIVVIGGESDRQRADHDEVEALDPSTGRRSALPRLRQGRHGTGAVVHGGLIHVVGGSSERGAGPELVAHETLGDF